VSYLLFYHHRRLSAHDNFPHSYLLSNGEHPFGSRFERELNILKGEVDLSRLDTLGEEGNEAKHLVLNLIDPDPTQRAPAAQIPAHPFFWDANKRLSFLTNASDRFDTMERDPPAPPLVKLEEGAVDVIGPNWHRKLDQLFIQDLGKFRTYDPKKVQDLLRAMRNKVSNLMVQTQIDRLTGTESFQSHHYQDMQPRLQQIVGQLPDGFLTYFTSRFPRLFLHVYAILISQPLIRSEPRFKLFFTPEPDN
jgi:serine/threonine-protein kinase/endoribonuclease IRE1